MRNRLDAGNVPLVVWAALGVLTRAAMPVRSLSGQSRPVRVYVFTAESAVRPVDFAAKSRAESVQDIRKTLARKRKAIAVVEDPADADLTLEVTGRELVTTEHAGFDTLGRTTVTPETTATVLVTLSVGEYSTRIAGRGGSKSGMWTLAAKDVANQVERFVRDNAARIPRR